MSGVEQVEHGRCRGLDRKQPLSFKPDRPAGAQRGNGTVERRRLAQRSNSRIKGTWSDGFSQLRHGSSTRWLVALTASAGLAHI